MTTDDLISNGHIILLGGSETTATLLAGVTWLLLQNPAALARVTQEVRSAFTTEAEITITSVSTLPYMLACLNEALRIYPPVASGLPRRVPKGGAFIGGVFVPENVRSAFFISLQLA
jgi:cytochrome P450